MSHRTTASASGWLAAIFLLCACTRAPAGSGGAGGGAPPPPPEVGVVTVAPSTVPLSYEFSAQVVPYRRVEVRPRVEGIIQQRPFTEGATVSAGQLLYRIESAKYEAAFTAAQARVDAAKLRLERYEPLLAQHAVAAQDVDLARSDVQAAQSALAQAKRDYDDTFVRAEINGRVGRTLLEVGARVSGPTDLLTTIDRLDPVYVTFQPSTQQLLDWTRTPASRALIVPGSRLRIEAVLADGSVLPREGKLDFVAPSLNGNTGTQEFRAIFANADHVLLPGQFVRARLVGFNAEQALTVPQRAVQTSLGRQFVYVVGAGDTVRSHDIQPGPWSGNRWIIREGLKAGDRVVVDGIQKVGPGRPVRPVAAVDSSVRTSPGGAGQ
ncbi:MAG: efflux RND transporter periplasmic adaptor subunit [Gemmatimonadaceae bacterium]